MTTKDQFYIKLFSKQSGLLDRLTFEQCALVLIPFVSHVNEKFQIWNQKDT